jgi:uncharacterized protein (UPF0147 family)
MTDVSSIYEIEAREEIAEKRELERTVDRLADECSALRMACRAAKSLLEDIDSDSLVSFDTDARLADVISQLDTALAIGKVL